MQENMRRCFRIVHRPVVVFQRNIEHPAQSIQGMFVLLRQKNSGHDHGIQIGKIRRQGKSFGIFPDKSRIEGSIVRYQHGILAEA